MKFTLSWLKDHLETDATVEAIRDTLTRIGLEVESIEDPAKDLAPFVVAHVVEATKHPNADKLRVCKVDIGQGAPVQVVCGAPNARAGMKGVYAPPGSHIPGTKLDLKKGVIRGVESNGMLLSEREMGLSDDHEGIVDLPADAPVGQSYAALMGLGDPVIDIAITPNRPDALGIRGIARDLAAAGLGTLKPWAYPPVKGAFKSPIAWSIDTAGGTNACSYVVGRYFRNVANGPSPEWMQRRLVAIGLRPISALVDITNFVTYHLGRPLHVFDADKLAGDLVMRAARAGEEILALDGRTYTLTPEDTVIADAKGVHGIGGVMGGEHTGCTPETKNVFLESALFDRVRVAATGRRHGILSDARYRFERGVDPESADWGAEVAAKLIAECCGGEASEPVTAGEMPKWRRIVTFRPARLESLGGLAVPEAEVRRILDALGFAAEGAGERWSVAVPPWRPDADGEADVIEEVLRIHGYDKIPPVSMRPEGLPRQTVTPQQRRVRLARRALAARGLFEAVTWSFMNSKETPLFGGGQPELVLANPISADLDAMRPSILGNLLHAAQRNADRGLANAALFEVGPQYAGGEPGDQALVAAGVRQGQSQRHWAEKARKLDAYDAKADALAALEAAGGPVASLQTVAEAPAWYHPGRSGSFKIGNVALAHFGEVHPRILKALDVDGPAVAFEVYLDRLPPPRSKAGKARPLLKPSPFQPVERDFAFVVDLAVPAEKLLRAAQNADKALVAGAAIFDAYAGPGIPDGKKSIALSVTIQPTEKTLTDAEIEAIGAKIVAAVTKQTGGTLRG
ncbi:MAG: phenylalanine--tRNA ligase subunit beta [Rhodospirillaceae bacterium]|nr:phenylalanine--tRNA ligase subunit beta [Rhodospirillaceae bacterium]